MKPKPSEHLLAYWTEALQRHEPFSRMHPDHVRSLVMSAREHYAPDGTSLLRPEDGVPECLFWVRQGAVTGHPLPAGQAPFELEAGSLWPIGALKEARPVGTVYQAHGDCFYLSFPWSVVQGVMPLSLVLARHIEDRWTSTVHAAARSLRQSLQAQRPEGGAMERPLSSLARRQVLCLPQQTPLRQALQAMLARRVGSVLLSGSDGQPSGILTRHDLLDRVVLAGVDLDDAAAVVMSQPVHAIEERQSLADAALLMARLGVRHLPVMREGQLVNIVSERDLFFVQQKTLRHVAGLVSAARTLGQWQDAAVAIRELAAHLLAQGAPAGLLTELISDLNDRLTGRIIGLTLEAQGLDDSRMCWIALGSEGRQEQTIATDQDNALVFESAQPDLDRPRWQAFARRVNETLDACGYPLCKGGIMASTQAWCRTRQEWQAQVAQWIERGSPEDLLNAAIFFDMRALAGQSAWASDLQAGVLRQVQANPRFLRQWVDNHLLSGVALHWHGGLAVDKVGGRETIDIKRSGTAIVVDAARILALSCGLSAVSTPQRLRLAGRQLGIPPFEYEGWVTAFEYLQTLRLQQQILGAPQDLSPNGVDIQRMNMVNRQMLKTVFRAIQGLQQRLQLDYIR